MYKKIALVALVAVVATTLAVTIPLLLRSSSPAISPNEPQMTLKGQGVLLLKDQDGNILEQRSFDNLITNAGFDAICDSVGNPTQPDNFDYIAVGTGTTAPAATDTALQSHLAREQGTYSHTAGTKVWTVVATFNPGEATGAITESGVLNAASGGTLLCRQTFAVVNKGANDTLEITWTFTLSQP